MEGRGDRKRKNWQLRGQCTLTISVGRIFLEAKTTGLGEGVKFQARRGKKKEQPKIANLRR